jgi:hypothetical protein
VVRQRAEGGMWAAVVDWACPKLGINLCGPLSPAGRESS